MAQQLWDQFGHLQHGDAPADAFTSAMAELRRDERVSLMASLPMADIK
jgi:hypothetical protein